MLYCKERGRINETNYHYSIISPPYLQLNLIGKKGGVMSSEYGTELCAVPVTCCHGVVQLLSSQAEREFKYWI